MKIASQHLANIQASEKKHEEDNLKTTSKKLESLFITQILKAMEKTIPKESGSSSSNLASMMFSTTMGKEIAVNGGIGLADFIYKGLATNKIEGLENLEKKINMYDVYKLKNEVNND